MRTIDRTIDRITMGEAPAPGFRPSFGVGARAPHAYRRLRRKAVRLLLTMVLVGLLLTSPVLARSGAFASDRAGASEATRTDEVSVWATS